MVEKICQLRLKGTIILKQNIDSKQELSGEKRSNSIKNKISNGIFHIKEAIKPQVNEKTIEKGESGSISKDTTTHPSIDDSFNYCQNCGAKKDKEAKFCPSCGAQQIIQTSQAIPNDLDSSNLKEDKTIQEVFDTLNEEQKRMVEMLYDLAINNITDPIEAQAYFGDTYLDDTTEEKTLKEVFDTLNDEQQQAVYAIMGVALEEAEIDDANHYIIRFDTVINRTNIVINGIFIKQLDKNQYFDFKAEVNVRYDIELSTIIFVALESKKKLTILEKNSYKNKWIGFGTAGNLAIEDFDMTSAEDIGEWKRVRPKLKEVI